MFGNGLLLFHIRLVSCEYGTGELPTSIVEILSITFIQLFAWPKTELFYK